MLTDRHRPLALDVAEHEVEAQREGDDEEQVRRVTHGAQLLQQREGQDGARRAHGRDGGGGHGALSLRGRWWVASGGVLARVLGGGGVVGEGGEDLVTCGVAKH